MDLARLRSWRVYSVPELAAKLRRLADALESGEPFRSQVAGKRVSVPRRAQISVEHERGTDEEEVELQLRWGVADLPGRVEDNEPLVSHWEPGRRLRRCPQSYDSRVMNPVSAEEDR